MQTINIANGPENASRLILGCMRMPALSNEAAAKMIETAVELGINFVDHATCYGDGEAEIRSFSQSADSGLISRYLTGESQTSSTAWTVYSRD